MTLRNWARFTYGVESPSVHTLRAWARQGRIWPAPMRHGRSYYVEQDATYVDPKAPIVRLRTAPRGALARKLRGEAGDG